MEEEINVPGLRISVTKEVLYDDVRDIYTNIKGMFALQQQFYFSSLSAFHKTTGIEEESMVKIIALHPHREELVEKLSLFGLTQLDTVLEPGTVEVKYPKYNSRLEYRGVDIYNTVFIENLPENPVKILRIERHGSSISELFCVRKKDSWSMREWSEVLLYHDRNVFGKRIDSLLQFFDISKKDFEYAVSSFNACEDAVAVQ